MQHLVVHKIGVGSLAKLVGVWYAIVSVIIGVVGAVVAAVNVFADNHYSVWAGIGISILIAIGGIIIYPLVSFFIGWIQGAIVALVFNVVIAGSGGLSLDVEESKLEVTKR